MGSRRDKRNSWRRSLLGAIKHDGPDATSGSGSPQTADCWNLRGYTRGGITVIATLLIFASGEPSAPRGGKRDPGLDGPSVAQNGSCIFMLLIVVKMNRQATSFLSSLQAEIH